MVRAEGIYFYDSSNKRYIDMNSQLMCTNIGHQHPRIINAIKKQADELCFAGPTFATNVRAEIGPILSKYTPNKEMKFFFTLGGAEANENAIKFARMYTNKQKIITRYRSYHGATSGAMTLTGDPRRWPHENNNMPGVIRVFDPYMYRSILYKENMSEEEFSLAMIKQLEETIIYENPNNIAAMIIETVTGTNGIIIPPKNYLKLLRELLTKYNILMICDEVMCGLGRTGEWFAVDHWNVVPDIITMAKGLTSGYLPLGAVAVSKEIAAHFDNKPFGGGLTYSGHPMCLAVACETLKVMEDEKIIENTKKMGDVMKMLHKKLKEKHSSVGDVRNIGLFGAIELVKSKKTKEPLVPYNGTHPVVPKLMAFLREKGIYCFINGHILHTNPPLIITAVKFLLLILFY